MSTDVPNILELIPRNLAGDCLRYCLDTLGLFVKDTQLVLFNAYKTAQAINIILSAEVVSTDPEGTRQSA